MEVIIEIQSHPAGAPRSFIVSLSTENSSAGMHNYYIYTSMFALLFVCRPRSSDSSSQDYLAIRNRYVTSSEVTYL